MKLFRRLLGLSGLFVALTALAADDFESAFRTSLLKSFDDATGKILRLADAIPEGVYDWRPMEGVNSVRDVLVHLSETNYALAARLGAKMPADIDRRKLGDSVRTKAEAIVVIKKSIEFMRGILAAIPAVELTPEVSVFGARAPKLRVALLPVDHAHEHLGQLIAYARMNRIVPPWSK